MTIAEATKILDLHQQWRRGAEIEMQNVVELGIALDTIIEYFENKHPVVEHGKPFACPCCGEMIQFGLSKETLKAMNDCKIHSK